MEIQNDQYLFHKLVWLIQKHAIPGTSFIRFSFNVITFSLACNIITLLDETISFSTILALTRDGPERAFIRDD